MSFRCHVDQRRTHLKQQRIPYRRRKISPWQETQKDCAEQRHKKAKNVNSTRYRDSLNFNTLHNAALRVCNKHSKASKHTMNPTAQLRAAIPKRGTNTGTAGIEKFKGARGSAGASSVSPLGASSGLALRRSPCSKRIYRSPGEADLRS
jgi:hypothetical protein